MYIHKMFFFTGICLPVLLALETLAFDGAILDNKDLTLSSTQTQSITTSRNLHLADTTVKGEIVAGKNMYCYRCSISGSVTAGEQLTLDHCSNVSKITSGDDATIRQSRVLTNATVGGNLLISNSMMDENVRVGKQVTLEDTTIKGELSLAGDYAKFTRSQVNDIKFSGLRTSSSGHNSISINTSSMNKNNSVIGSGNIISNGTGMVSVGTNSMSQVNGYKITSSQDQTVVMTPEQSVYVNGIKVSGNGPKYYADFRAQFHSAPIVNGPGWTEGKTEKTYPPKAGKKNETVVNVLELLNNSTVNGDVIFESGYGTVKIYPGSFLKGKVINGSVERVKTP